ncbi:MAG: hypothetical protein HWN65_24125 [Candidatus Helarchaeota archaeon]|nr:hypothetical protein [Candidatus Helarchaeota archaeon]
MVPLGYFLAILAGLMFTGGAALQKKGVQNLPDIKMGDINTIMPMLKNKTWVIGTAIAVSGGIPYVASQSIIGIGNTQLLISIGLILLVVMAYKIFNESLGIMEYSGITLLITGTIFLGLSNLKPVEVTLSDPNFFLNALIFYLIFSIAIAAGLIFYKFSDKGLAKNLGINSGIWFGLGACSAQIGTLGLVAGNLWILLIGYFILLLGNMVGTVVVNVAFQKGKIVVVIPLQSTGNYLIPAFAGLTIFGQVFHDQFFGWIFFGLSLGFIMAGVVLLSRIQAEIEKPKTSSESEEEHSSSETTSPPNN